MSLKSFARSYGLLIFFVPFVLSTSSTAPTARDESAPKPLSFPANQFWDGIDGDWSTFTIRAGSPPTFVRALISTANQQTWTVDPRNCDKPDPFPDSAACLNSRGLSFDSRSSSSWSDIGSYGLQLEKNLNYTGDASYGYDTVSLGTEGSPLVTIENSTVGIIKSQDYWLGYLGLHNKPSNFQSFAQSSPSFMTYLKDQGHIPSMSFGYTAGNPYRFTKVLGSLTLGGYDQSKFIPNHVSFPFAPDNSRDLVVGIQNIVMKTDSKAKENGTIELLKTPIYAFIDSSVSQLWLPVEICTLFEQQFGLTYDDETDLYLVDDILHQQMLDLNANVTFTLGVGLKEGPTVDIVLPYSAFDLTAEPPYHGLTNNARYFPLRRATDKSMYTLGRMFLQEAYLVVDWERSNFTVSQCLWELNTQPNIITISPFSSPSSANSPGSTGARVDPNANKDDNTKVFIGVGIGVAGAITVAGIFAWIFWRRWRRTQLKKLIAEANAAQGKGSPIDDSFDGSESEDRMDSRKVFPKAELPADVSAYATNLKLATGSEGSINSNQPPTPRPPVETEGVANQIYEMEGSFPERNEADGRQFSEKEAIVFRERIYNGTDPGSPSSSSTPSTPNFSRPHQISAGDITPVVDTQRSLTTMTPVSPFRSDQSQPRVGRAVTSTVSGSRSGESLLLKNSNLSAARRRFSFEGSTEDEQSR